MLSRIGIADISLRAGRPGASHLRPLFLLLADLREKNRAAALKDVGISANRRRAPASS
jgi:hypothetical protein